MNMQRALGVLLVSFMGLFFVGTYVVADPAVWAPIQEWSFTMNGRGITAEENAVLHQEATKLLEEHRPLIDRVDGLELFRTSVKEVWNEETRNYYVSARATVLSDFPPEVGDSYVTRMAVESVPQYGLNGEQIGWSSGPELTPEPRAKLRHEAIMESWQEAVTKLLEALK